MRRGAETREGEGAKERSYREGKEARRHGGDQEEKGGVGEINKSGKERKEEWRTGPYR